MRNPRLDAMRSPAEWLAQFALAERFGFWTVVVTTAKPVLRASPMVVIMCRVRRSRRGAPRLLLAVTLLASAALAQPTPAPEVRMDFPQPLTAEGYCQDSNGNVYTLPLRRYQSGLQPVGPCVPVGSGPPASAWRMRIEAGMEAEAERYRATHPE